MTSESDIKRARRLREESPCPDCGGTGETDTSTLDIVVVEHEGRRWLRFSVTENDTGESASVLVPREDLPTILEALDRLGKDL